MELKMSGEFSETLCATLGAALARAAGLPSLGRDLRDSILGLLGTLSQPGGEQGPSSETLRDVRGSDRAATLRPASQTVAPEIQTGTGVPPIRLAS